MALKSPSLTPSFLLLALTTALIVLLRNVRLRSTHESEPFQLTTATPLFSYKVSTYHNTRGKRCALLRCTSLGQTPTLIETFCDNVLVDATPKAKHAPSLCAADYVHAHWDELSRKYNDGLAFVANDVVLSVRSHELPTEGEHVHFPRAPDAHSLSPAWFSVFPRNSSRAVFRAWARAAAAAQPGGGGGGAEAAQAALNSARSCRDADVMCHARWAGVARRCDAAAAAGAACRRRSWGAEWAGALCVAATVGLCAASAADALRGVVPRRRLERVSAVVRPRLSGTRREVAVFGALAVAVVAGLAAMPRWAEMVRTASRPLSVSWVHRFDERYLEEATEVYRGVAGLRGQWSGHAYVYSDGVERVRVSGPGTGVVVRVVGMALEVREAMRDGLVVKCLLGWGVWRAVCVGVAAVVGFSPRRREEEEEEYLEKGERAAFRRETRGRSFVLQRERGNTGVV